MPRRGKRGKPKTGFPLFPPRLEIAKSAITTFPQAAIAMMITNESQNPGSRPRGRKPKPLPAGAFVGYKKV